MFIVVAAAAVARGSAMMMMTVAAAGVTVGRRGFGGRSSRFLVGCCGGSLHGDQRTINIQEHRMVCVREEEVASY